MKAVAVLLCLTSLAQATPDSETATFALIIGVNRSVDKNLQPLRYADDDAARYHQLFRTLGGRTYLLMRADDNTRRLHPQAVAEALDPTAAMLERTVQQIRLDVAQAHARGIRTVFYLLYAGHGDASDGEGFVSLEDTRLTGRRIATEIVDRIDADRSHLVIDACQSYFLVFGRGPTESRRRPLGGFATLEEVFDRGRVGLLFSTSSARESHEWDAFQAGVFSHEVRSGLLGAADVDGDGQISYREMAAFIERANQAVPNERFRPDVYARPPATSDLLVDLRPSSPRRLQLDGTKTGHFLIEDARGVRLADFHNGVGQALSLLRPISPGPLFLRRVADGAEWTLPTADEIVVLGEPHETQVAMRGAAHESFGALFALPFDVHSVDAYRYRAIDPPRVWVGWSKGRIRRTIAGASLLGFSLATLLGGVGLTVAAKDVHDGILPGLSQVEVARRNQTIVDDHAGAAALYGLAGAAAIIGTLCIAWPESKASR